MIKKRSSLTTFAIALLIFVVMLTLIPLHAHATTSDEESEPVMGIVTADYLNVRDAPFTNSSSHIIGILKKETVVVIEDSISSRDNRYKDWFKINYYGEIAYVAKDYVDYADVSETENLCNSCILVENCRGMTTASKLNLRSEPTTNSNKITSLPRYTYIDILEMVYMPDVANRVWLRIQHGDLSGYVAKRYVKILDNQPVNTSDDFGITTGYIRLRTNPTTSSQEKEIIFMRNRVTILDSVTTCDEYEKWYKVQAANGNIGWIAGDYLQVGKWTLSSTARTWSSSDRNRNKNIALACSYINGQIIVPGKDFSWFESVLGSCSEEKGFLPATIYLNGAHEKGAGGGVCQVSTTINMAIKKLGIPTNAHQHSLPVRYAKKEDEATVSYPNHNFSFENTLDRPILIEMVATSASCTCNVYVLEQ